MASGPLSRSMCQPHPPSTSRQELAYLQRWNHVAPHPAGRLHRAPDAAWEVVKTTHTDDSVGFIVQTASKLAYLVDSFTPPPMKRWPA